MDLVQSARSLYERGDLQDALQAAQAACDRLPGDADAWWLLGCIARHAGLTAASDIGFERAARLSNRYQLPFRVSPAKFDELATAVIRQTAGGSTVRESITVAPLPSVDQIRRGVRPDALSVHGEQSVPSILFQVNHENRSSSEEDLKRVLAESLAPRH